jgi:hypothetical protein
MQRNGTCRICPAIGAVGCPGRWADLEFSNGPEIQAATAGPLHRCARAHETIINPREAVSKQ